MSFIQIFLCIIIGVCLLEFRELNANKIKNDEKIVFVILVILVIILLHTFYADSVDMVQN